MLCSLKEALKDGINETEDGALELPNLEGQQEADETESLDDLSLNDDEESASDGDGMEAEKEEGKSAKVEEEREDSDGERKKG